MNEDDKMKMESANQDGPDRQGSSVVVKLSVTTQEIRTPFTRIIRKNASADFSHPVLGWRRLVGAASNTLR